MSLSRENIQLQLCFFFNFQSPEEILFHLELKKVCRNIGEMAY